VFLGWNAFSKGDLPTLSLIIRALIFRRRIGAPAYLVFESESFILALSIRLDGEH
jgi:hypothetical protein